MHGTTLWGCIRLAERTMRNSAPDANAVLVLSVFVGAWWWMRGLPPELIEEPGEPES